MTSATVRIVRLGEAKVPVMPRRTNLASMWTAGPIPPVVHYTTRKRKAGVWHRFHGWDITRDRSMASCGAAIPGQRAELAKLSIPAAGVHAGGNDPYCRRCFPRKMVWGVEVIVP